MKAIKTNKRMTGCRRVICCGKFHVHWNMASYVFVRRKYFRPPKTTCPPPKVGGMIFLQSRKICAEVLMNKLFDYGY